MSQRQANSRRRVSLRSLAIRLLLAGMGVVLALGVTEALLTAANIAPARRRGAPWGLPNEVYGWGYRPGATFTYDGTYEKFGSPSKINSKGLREREYAYEKPAGVFRVLVLGDSLTTSLEVPLEQTWHELLEAEVNKAGGGSGRVEVIAAAIQGWSTDQQYLYYLHEGFKYTPDIVLVQFYANDIYGNGVEVQKLTRVPTETNKPFFVLDEGRLVLTDPFRTEPPPPQTAGPVERAKAVLRDHLRTYRLAAQVRQGPERRRNPRVPFCYQYDGIPPELYTYAPDFPPEYKAAWAVTGRLFEELKNETAKRGQRLAVLYIPDRRQVLPGQWQRTLDCWPAAAQLSWDLDKPNHSLESALAQLQTPYLDPTETFRQKARAGQSIYFETDWHLNPAGHRFVASLLLDWLRSESLIPR